MSKLAILGGGIGGSCLGLALKRHGFTSNPKHSIRLIEQEPFRVNTFGGGITLTPNAIRGLDSLGLYSKIRKYSVPLKNIFAYNQKGKLIRKHDYGFVEQQYGYPVLLMDRTYLNMALVEDIPQHWWKLGNAVDAVEQDEKGVVAIYDDGNFEDFDALVGCDGVDSVVAEYIRRETKQLPKEQQEEDEDEDDLDPKDDYELEIGATTILGVSEPLKSPSIAPGDIHWVFGESLVYGAYALKDNRVVWFVTFVDEDPETFWSPETAENMKEINESSMWFVDGKNFNKHEFFEKTEKAIKVGTGKYVTELTTWSKNRITLLGDAAHSTFPYIGYGPNTAIEDAIMLSNRIMKYPSKLELAFKEYESKRIERCTRISEFAADTLDLHAQENESECWWRDKLMQYTPNFLYNSELKWIYGYQPIISKLEDANSEFAEIPANLPASKRADAIGKFEELPDPPKEEIPQAISQPTNPKDLKPTIAATITPQSKANALYAKHKRRVKVF